MDNNLPSKKRKLDYKWVIIVMCFMLMFTGFGFCSSGRTMYLTAITKALGFSRGAFSLNNTFRFLTQTILNLFFGRLVMKFGTKKLICAGLVSMILFTIINANAMTLPMFYLGGIFLGIGLSWIGTSMVSLIITRWCPTNRGTIMGAVLSANGLGGAFAVQVITPIIFEEGNPFGYQNSYRMVTWILLALLVLVIFLYRELPGKEGEVPIGKKKKKIRGAGWVGMPYEDVVRKPYFYASLGCMFLIGMVLQGLGEIVVPHYYDLGIDVGYVATVTSISSIMLMGTKFVIGYFYDRFGMKLTMNLSLVSAFLAMISLVLIQNTPVGRVLMFVRTVFNSIALPLETVMLPIFATEFFGNRDFDKIIGICVGVSSAGFAIGSPFGNFCFDLFGSYNIAFIIFASLMAVAAIALQFVLKAANRDRKIIEAALEAEKEAATEA